MRALECRKLLRLGGIVVGILLVGIVPVWAQTLYVAVPDGPSPGIWKVVDLNFDLDALDGGEVTRFAAGEFTDVGASGTGVVYAVESGSAKIYRIEDKDSSGDALGPGETTIFRDDQPGNAAGVLLKAPASIAVATFFDPFMAKSRTFVYTMDVVLQQGILLEDRDDDGSANESTDITVMDTYEVAFTPERMVIDRAGRIVAVNANQLTLARLDDVNGDFAFEEIRNECPAVPPGGCGPGLSGDFQVIRSFQPAQQPNLEGPFGVTLLSDGEWLVSDPESGNVYKLIDADLDEDAQSASEIDWYAEAGPQFDLAADDRDVVYLGVGFGQADIMRIEDKDGNGNALDPGEFEPYANVPGTPLGLEVLPLLDTRTLAVRVESGVEISPLKGPVLVVEDGITTSMQLKVVDDVGNPVAFERMANSVVSGCFSVCSSPTNQTDGSGIISYDVDRTFAVNESESIKFWVQDGSGGRLGQNENVLLLPVISTPCTPGPVADAGPDQLVPAGSSVSLNGTGSIGPGLRHCWTQTGGPDLALPECGGEQAAFAFTAPDSPTTLTFSLETRNACDVFSSPDEVVVDVFVPAACDADGDGDIDRGDAFALWKFLLLGTPLAGDGDCNEDGVINFRDIRAVRQKL